MIIDLTGSIMQRLLTESSITHWVSKLNGIAPNISANTTPSGQLPAIVVYEMDNRDGEFADDRPFSSIIRYQLTLFSEDGAFAKVPNTVDEIMRSLGFTRDNVFTRFDKDTKIYQKILLFSAEPTFDN